jgi:cytoskeletal protein CcmA (bactofilin family)
MFKRPKGVSDPDPSAQTHAPGQDEPSKSARGETADTSGEAGTRVITPSYQARKPTVRTLHTPAGQQPATPTTPAANLHVGRGLKLEGKIQSCDSLVIEGDVQATIESGTLTISETGEVRGDATVDEAEINGKFDGTLTVRKCLTINATGRVTGTVRYGELRVEQGGQVSGEIQAEDAKQGSRPASKATESTESKSETSTNQRSASGV